MAFWEIPGILDNPTTPTAPNAQVGDAKPYVGLGLIHTGVVPFEWAISFRYLNIPYNHVFMHSTNAPYDCSRETVVRGLLGYGVEWIFFNDTDVLPPRDAVPTLISLAQQHDKPVVSGLYWAKKKEETPMPAAWMQIGTDPIKNAVTYKSLENEVKPYLDKNALVEVDVVGAGCLLIRADIFKKLEEKDPKKPFFQWGLGRKDELTGKPLPQMSEDFYFCERLKEIGVKPHLCTAIKCDHLAFPNARRRAIDGRLEI